MSRLAKSFRSGSTSLIPYLPAGYPSRERFLELLRAAESGGADAVEIGVPFSDPTADGGVIQQAYDVAIENGVTLTWVLDELADFRAGGGQVALVLMTYLNPIERMGFQRFADRAEQSGVDGVLIVDAPAESVPDLRSELRSRNIDNVLLLASTTSAERRQSIAAKAQGFLYYVSFKGITGADALQTDQVATEVAALRSECEIPIAVGFGIKTPEQAAAIGKFADGVIVGSALIGAINESDDPRNAVFGFVSSFRKALPGSDQDQAA